jgi:hypothetical protein
MKLTNFIFESNDTLANIKKIAAHQDFSIQQRAEYIFNVCKHSLSMLGQGSNPMVSIWLRLPGILMHLLLIVLKLVQPWSIFLVGFTFRNSLQ